VNGCLTWPPLVKRAVVNVLAIWKCCEAHRKGHLQSKLVKLVAWVYASFIYLQLRILDLPMNRFGKRHGVLEYEMLMVNGEAERKPR